MDASLRLVRILHVALLVSVAVYPLMGEAFGPAKHKDVERWQLILVAFAVANVVTLAPLRRRLIASSEEAMRMQPDGPALLRRWQSGHIVSFAIAEAVALYGLGLRFLGGTLLQALPFYAAAVVLMLVFTPRRPE